MTEPQKIPEIVPTKSLQAPELATINRHPTPGWGPRPRFARREMAALYRNARAGKIEVGTLRSWPIS